LRSALDKVEKCLDGQQYREVANLGYRDVSSEFIFLQRTMATINDKALARTRTIQEIAAESKVAYDDVNHWYWSGCKAES